MPKLHKLRNQVKHYEWGSPDFIPRLLGTPGGGTPAAELWMGCHPSAPSMTDDNTGLGQLIAENPRRFLGEDTAKKYGELPFLFKLLAAQKPLSIQAHPNEAQAREGFERENRAGLPLDAPNRCYKDPHHKPELLCALTPFTGMCGFREPDEIRNSLEIFFTQRRVVPQAVRGAEGNALIVQEALATVLSYLDNRDKEVGLRGFFEALFRINQVERQAITEYILAFEVPSPLRSPRSPRSLRETLGTNFPEWELMRKFAELYPGDPAVLSPLYLNVFCLQPGEAVFLKAGVLHAYISGFAVELMANSDNVLRGGLTGKYVDVPELMKILDFNPMKPRIIKSDPALPFFTYPAPCGEFSLTVMRGEGEGANKFAANESSANSAAALFRKSPSICIVMEGETIFADSDGETVLRQGESAFIPPAGGSPLSLRGRFTLYASSCPL